MVFNLWIYGCLSLSPKVNYPLNYIENLHIHGLVSMINAGVVISIVYLMYIF